MPAIVKKDLNFDGKSTLPKFSSDIANAKDLVFVFQHLKHYLSKELAFSRIYSSKLNGDNATQFHKQCDCKGATLVLIRDSDRNIFGGYTNLQWSSPRSAQGESGDTDSFLFSVNKSRIIQHNGIPESTSITNNRLNGPIFGDDDLVISDQCTRNYDSWNFMKNSYGKNDDDLTTSYLTSGKIEFKVELYEVFTVK